MTKWTRSTAVVDPAEPVDSFIAQGFERARADFNHPNEDVSGIAKARRRDFEIQQTALQRMTPADKARFQEAWEVFQRMRRGNPRLAQVDEIEAFGRMRASATRSRDDLGTGNRYTPEEMVAVVATANNVPISPDELSRAAGVSLMNAEGAIAASAPHATFGEVPVYNPALDEVFTPGAITGPRATPPRGAAGSPDPTPPTRPATEPFDEILTMPERQPGHTVPPPPGLQPPGAIGSPNRFENAADSPGAGRTVPPPPGRASGGMPRTGVEPTSSSASGASAPTNLESPGVPRLVDSELRGRTTTVSSGGATAELRIGEMMNEGSFNQVYHEVTPNGQPTGRIIRVSHASSDHPGVRLDISGRRALEGIRDRASGRLEFVEAETYTNVESPDPTLRGRTVSVMERLDSGRRADRQLQENPAGQPTNGQAIAYDRAVRALNNEGYAIIDGHPANFYFRKTGEPDDWVMVIIDPGGIVPVHGLDPRTARGLQALVDNPPDRLPRTEGRSPGSDRGIASYLEKAEGMAPEIEQHVDANAIGLSDIRQIVGGNGDRDPLFKPSGAEDFPVVRQLFDVPDSEVEAAYEALRKQSLTPGP